MRFVLTLVGDGREPASLEEGVRRLASALGAEPRWLADGEACDLFLEADEPTAIAARARALLGAEPIDLVVQKAAARKKRLLVADLESTTIENEMLNELAAAQGLLSQVSEITRRAMNGEIDFASALKARLELLKGLPLAALEKAAGGIRLMPGARALVATMRRDGAPTALVSGGFTFFAEKVAKELGFDRVVANRLEIRDGRVAGVLEPIVAAAEKRQALLSLAAEHRIPLSATLALGDGANDLLMLEAAGLGIAFRAKPRVAAAASARIDYGDLTALLYIQGYRREEIVR